MLFATEQDRTQPAGAAGDAAPVPAGGPGALADLASRLRGRIIGQDHVIAPLIRTVWRGETGTTDPRRPRGSFLFVGPTGVGKTETALALAAELGRGLFRLDMSECQLHESVTELLGGPGRRGRLELARGALGGGGILLFDEIEKAHPLVLDLMLQLLDAGRVTAAGGRELRFAGDYVILTSNIGARDAMRATRQNAAMFEAAVLEKVRQSLRPEIYNRIGRKVVFRPMEPAVQLALAELTVRQVCQRLAAKGWEVTVDAAGLALIKERGIDRYQGARPLRGIAEDLIEFAVADALVRGRPPAGRLTAGAGGLCFESEPARAPGTGADAQT